MRSCKAALIKQPLVFIIECFFGVSLRNMMERDDIDIIGWSVLHSLDIFDKAAIDPLKAL